MSLPRHRGDHARRERFGRAAGSDHLPV